MIKIESSFTIVCSNVALFSTNFRMSFLLQIAALSVALFRALNLTTRYDIISIMTKLIIFYSLADNQFF